MSANSTATVKKNSEAVDNSTAYVADQKHMDIYEEVSAIDAQIEALQKVRADALKPVRGDMETLNVSKMVDIAGATLFTLSTSDRTTVDSKRLKAEQPDTYKEFSNTKTVTTFKKY